MRPRKRKEDTIKISLGELDCLDMDWTQLTRVRVQRRVFGLAAWNL